MSNELQLLVDHLASRIQRSVAADDHDMHFLVASRHYGDEDPARIRAVLNRDLDDESVRYLLGQGILQAQDIIEIPASDELELKARRCFPIRWDGRLLGFLWLMDDRGDVDDKAAVECARQMALTIFGRSIRVEYELSRRESLVRDVLSSNHQVVSRAERDLREDGLLGDEALCVLVLEVQSLQTWPMDPLRVLRDQVAEVGRAITAGSILSTPIGERVFAALVPNRRAAADFETELIALLLRSRKSTNSDINIGIGTQVTPNKASLSYAQGRLAARASIVMPTLGPVASWSQLGVYGQLLQVATGGEEHLALPEALLALRAADKHGVLVETAECFLDVAGAAAACAEILHIHRSTLHYRVGRIEAVTGLDLSDGNDRLTLHLGLKISRVLEVGGTSIRQRAGLFHKVATLE